MATVCSCLKYYGHVIIGVARDEDRILVNDMVWFLYECKTLQYWHD